MESWLPKGSSSPQQPGVRSHLQLSKEAPAACPGLSIFPGEEWGSDALAPWRQQETDTHEVKNNQLGQGDTSLPCTAAS